MGGGRLGSGVGPLEVELDDRTLASGRLCSAYCRCAIYKNISIWGEPHSQCSAAALSLTAPGVRWRPETLSSSDWIASTGMRYSARLVSRASSSGVQRLFEFFGGPLTILN